MKADPKELRERVVAVVAQGEHTRAEIAHLFNVSRTFIKKMLRWQRAGQDLAPRQGGGPALLLQAPELALLCAEVGACPDATLSELQNVLAEKRDVTASLSTLCRALQQLELPRKKKAPGMRSAMKRNARSSAK